MKQYEQIHKHLLATVIKKRHGNKHSHKMIRFWIRIATWSSLHEPVRISESFHKSVFKSSVDRVICETRIRVFCNGFRSHQTGPNAATRNPTNELTRTYTRIHTNTYTPIHIIYIYIYIIYTYPNTHSQDTYTLTHAYNNTLTNPAHANTYIFTQIIKHMHIY